MIGLYFSGSGNTRYCIETFVQACDPLTNCYAIEDKQALERMKEEDTIIFAYPIYYSNLPKIVSDFLKQHAHVFEHKHIFIITTMGLFSGDGCGCGARILKSYGATIIGGIQVKMPDCIADEKALKRTLEKNKLIVRQATQKLNKAAKLYMQGTPPQEGLSLLSHMIGLFGQRLWFYNKTKHFSSKLRIHQEKCIGCGTCVQVCPMENIKQIDQKAVSFDQCTMCYRCVNICPQQAITLLGKQVHEQCQIKKYL